MTYGYGDSPDGWRPPSEPDPPSRGRRRAPEPPEEDERAGHGRGAARVPGSAPAPPPPFDPARPGPLAPRSGPPDPRYDSADPRYDRADPSYGPRDQRYEQPDPRSGPPDPRSGPPGRRYGPADPRSGPPDPRRDPPDPRYDPPDPRYDPRGQRYGAPVPRSGPPASGPAQWPAEPNRAPDDRLTPRRAADPGVYSSGSRSDRRPDAPAPGTAGFVPPPPASRPGWPLRGAPEAEPSWPTPDGSPAPTSGGGWDHGQPAGGWERGQATGQPWSAPGRASVPSARVGGSAARASVPSGRGTVSVAGSRVESPGAGSASDRLPNKLWMSVLGAVVVVALLVVAGVGTFLVVHGNGDGSANAKGGPARHDISNQQVDPAPLTTAEVFPANTVSPDPAGPAYQVVKAEESANCQTGAAGDLKALLSSEGCTQLVRATLLSPDQAYVLTSGILNLRDNTAAGAANNGIKSSVDAKKGRLTGLPAGGATDVLSKVATRLGWDTQGHFLAYCVLARADGNPIAANDPAATKIINDMVEVTLKGTVIAARITPRTPSANPSAPASK